MYETIVKVSKKYTAGFIIIIMIISTLTFDKKIEVNQNSYETNVTTYKSSYAYDINKEIDKFIEENIDIINFYEESFQINEGYIKTAIINYNKDNNILNPNAVLSEISYESFDHELFYFTLNLMDTDPDAFYYKHVPNYDSKEYMQALIDYFAQFYPSVNVQILKAIANIESGYNASTMLYKNNIFGGMSGGKVITYKTMEYGIFKYVSLLNNGYFSLGLTTVESIGYKYNPTINEFGQKVASPSWVVKVNSNITKFSSETITIEDLINLKNHNE